MLGVVNLSKTPRDRRCDQHWLAVKFSRRGDDMFSTSILVRGLAEFERYRPQTGIARGVFSRLIL